MRTLKPLCGHCHEEILGVVPVWKDGVPVCRQCVYGGALARSGRERAPNTGHVPGSGTLFTRSRVRTGIGILLLSAVLLVAGLKTGVIVRAVKPERPQYTGASELDRETEVCIANLWVVSKLLQSTSISWPDLKCPASDEPYEVVDVPGDTIVSCPSPEKHEVKDIRVSRTTPIPEVEL